MMNHARACVVIFRLPGGSSDRDRAQSRFRSRCSPYFADTCFTCHGPDDAKRKSGLRLDTRETAYKPAKSGKIAIVAGDPAHSELIARITAKDEDDRMPPAKTGKQLSSQQIETLRKWIAERRLSRPLGVYPARAPPTPGR